MLSKPKIQTMQSIIYLLSILSSVQSTTPDKNVYLSDVDPDNLEITGPGLINNSQLPYHYFFIKPKLKSNSNKFIESSILSKNENKPIPAKDLFEVMIYQISSNF